MACGSAWRAKSEHFGGMQVTPGGSSASSMCRVVPPSSTCVCSLECAFQMNCGVACIHLCVPMQDAASTMPFKWREHPFKWREHPFKWREHPFKCRSSQSSGGSTPSCPTPAAPSGSRTPSSPSTPARCAWGRMHVCMRCVCMGHAMGYGCMGHEASVQHRGREHLGRPV